MSCLRGGEGQTQSERSSICALRALFALHLGKAIYFQEGYKIGVFIFTTGGADPKAV